MKTAINLLQETQKGQAKLRRMGFLLQAGSIVVLGVVGGLVFLLLSYTLVLKFQQGRLVDRIAEQKTIIDGLRPVEARQLFIKQKFEHTSTVIDEPSLPHDLVASIYDLDHTNISVAVVSAQKGGGNVALSGVADDVFSLLTFLDGLTALVKEKGVDKVVSNAFSRGGDGSYLFDLSLSLSEG